MTQKEPENLILLETCDSTNRVAKELAKAGASHGTAVVSTEQTAGRGRLGRSFYSPKGNGLYVSFVLRPEEAPGEDQLVTCFAATAVRRAIEPFAEEAWGRKPSIKWVNDILIRRKKVCGILAEYVPAPQDAREGLKSPDSAIILGIGVNLFGEADFPAEIADFAAVLFPESYLGTLPGGGSEAERETLRTAVRDAVIREVRTWDGGPFDEAMIEEYRANSFLLGRSIHFILNGEEYFGVVTSVLDNGNLMVVLPEGKHIALSSGEVTLHRGIL